MDVSGSGGAIDHVTLRTAMRPPRAVILFRGDDHWREWARLALLAAQKTWAGGGHLLIPYSEDGEISEVLLPVIEAFDPDHILLLDYSIHDVEAIRPGHFRLKKSDGTVLEGEEREEFLKDMVGGDHVNDAAGDAAREQLEEFLSPFLFLVENGKKYQQHASIGTDGASGLTIMPPETFTTSHLAVRRAWTSDAALLAASVIGFADEDAGEAEAPPDDKLLSYALASRLRTPPDALWVGQPTEPVQSRNELLDLTVRDLTAGPADDAGAIVIGDSADDFALAMGYRLMLGRGIWVTSEMLSDDEVRDHGVGAVVSVWTSNVRRSAGKLRCVSASLSDVELKASVDRVDEAAQTWNYKPEPDEHLAVTDRPTLKRGLQRKFILEGANDLRSMPVKRREDGTMVMLNSFSPPVPQQSHLNDMPYWYVDVSFDGATMPTGRGLIDEPLKSSGEWDLVRSGANGLSITTASQGFVPTGAVQSAKISHPTLVSLGVRSWVEEMIKTHGLGARHSPAGRAAQLAARRLGSRRALIDLVSGRFQHVLLAYADDPSTNRERSERANTAGKGENSPVVLGGSPYLSFATMLGRVSDGEAEANTDWLREILDTLVEHDLARMGLILGCDDCGRPSFYGIDDLRQRFRCPLCAAHNLLAAARWKMPKTEPTWFYDIHTSLRQLASERGDLPIRAAAQLSAKARSGYGDCSELEFFEDGNRVAEIDLIAHVNGEVVVAEAKAGAQLGTTATKRGQQAAKIARIGRAVRADRIILATDRADWPETDVDVMKTAVSTNFRGIPSPTVERMVGI